MIDVAGITFDEAVARAWRSAMGAYKHAYYDPIELFELIARVGRERGEEIDIECFVNDRRMQGDEEPAGPYPTGRELTAALRRSTLTWGYQMDGPSERFFFHINKAPPGTVAYEMCVDTHYIAPADLEACIRGFEAAVVEAAFDPAALTGIRSTPLPALQ